MITVLSFVGALAWTAVVADVVWESARVGGASIVAFGRTIATPGARPGILVLVALAATAGVVLTAAAAALRGRRLERRMAAELDERYREITTRAAGDVARASLLSWRESELRTSTEALSARREELIAEMELARRRTAELRALAQDYRRSLTELQDRLVVLPDIEDELARRREQRDTAEPQP